MDKTKMTEQWEELSRRLERDEGLCEVLDSLSSAMKAIDGETESRPRLRVPYANASTLNSGTRWA